jgi:hypothetical protein
MSTPQDYTSTRIRRDYLAKLQELATKNKRSAMKQLEALIDDASRNLRQDGNAGRRKP